MDNSFKLWDDSTPELSELEQLKQLCAEQQEAIAALEHALGEAGRQQLIAEFASLEIHQVFSATADPIWAVRDDGIVIRANNAMLKVLDKDESEVVGRRCSELINYGYCDGERCPLDTIKSRRNQEFEVTIGNDHYSLVTSPLVTIVGTAAIVGHFRNITRRKQAEQQLEQLNKKLAEAANIDGLTQIANRRSFDAMFEREWLRHKRNQMCLSLVLIDIDFFKKYNDFYGHSAGDDCLIRVARAIKSAVKRPVDFVARYGGEEFVLLLPETPLDGALCVARRVRDLVASLNAPHPQSDVSECVTISQGAAAVIPTDQLRSIDLLNRADTALYAAKSQGRNRCSGYGAES